MQGFQCDIFTQKKYCENKSHTTTPQRAKSSLPNYTLQKHSDRFSSFLFHMKNNPFRQQLLHFLE